MRLASLYFVALLFIMPSNSSADFGPCPFLVSGLLGSRSPVVTEVNSQITSTIQIKSVDYPLGKSFGSIYYIEPYEPHFTRYRDYHASKRSLDLFIESTITGNRPLYAALGFSEKSQKGLSHIASIPSIELYNHLVDQWNSKHPVKENIFVKTYAAREEEKSLPLLKNWVENLAIGIVKPDLNAKRIGLKVFEDGALQGNVTVFDHDISQLINSICLPQAPLERNRTLGRFWLEVRALDRVLTEDQHSKDVKARVLTYLMGIHNITHIAGSYADQKAKEDLVDDFSRLTIEAEASAREFVANSQYPQVKEIWAKYNGAFSTPTTPTQLEEWADETIYRQHNLK